MNKKTTLPLLLLIAVLTSMAQKQPKLPSFGDVSKSELEMKECSFEKNAAAMVVFSKGTSVYVFRMATDDYIETEYHYRIKIFNKKGFNHANIKIPYPNTRSGMGIKGIKAQTYNLDAAGNIVVSKVEKATIYDKKINQNYSEKTFALPDIKEGSIIEYTYTIENGYSTVWNFQWTIPVMTSMFVIDFSNEFEIRTIPNVSMPLRQWTVSKSNNNISYYVMEQIPSLDDEPYMSCAKDYLQRMEFVMASVTIPGRMPFQFLHDWPWVVKALMDNDGFGGQLKKDIPHTGELDVMLNAMSDPYQKMVTIHNYVRNNMEWDKDYSIWAPDGVKNAWRNKKGSTGEINMIMINLMRDANLVAHPVLVSTRKNGIINTGVPNVDHFDKVLAYVEIGDKYYVLDATDKNTPAYLIPLEVSASEGLVIEKISTYEWGWKPLWDGDHTDYTNVFFTGEITDQHVLSCGAEVTAYDYAKVKLTPTVKLGKDAMKSNLTSVPDVKVDSIEVLNATVDTLPLVEKFNFTMPTTATGDYHYFSINLFGGLEKNPFYADQRQTDIFFGVKRSYKINANIYLPAGYEMDEMPKNIKMITPDTGMVFTRMSFFKDGLLTIRVDLDFKSPIYEVGNYEEFKEFYKKLFGMLNERYVYKKAAK